jgi:arginine/lysine/ornithine decarboxylase
MPKFKDSTMKFKNILTIGIFLLAATISRSEEMIDITKLIEEAKKAPFEKRFKLILKIKKTIASMNDENRAMAIAEVQTQRKSFRKENNMSQKQVDAFKAKMKAYEANTSKGSSK